MSPFNDMRPRDFLREYSAHRLIPSRHPTITLFDWAKSAEELEQLAQLEDACRVRKEAAPENLAIIRHIAMNLLKQEATAKVGIKNKRLMAGWDHKYTAKLLDLGEVD